MILFDKIKLNVNILIPFLHSEGFKNLAHLTEWGWGRGCLRRVKTNPGELNLNVTRPDGECSRNVVSSPVRISILMLDHSCENLNCCLKYDILRNFTMGHRLGENFEYVIKFVGNYPAVQTFIPVCDSFVSRHVKTSLLLCLAPFLPPPS